MKLKINDKYLDIKVAESFQERIMGFMGKINIDYGILFPECNSIHTFFMKEEIDVIGLNENNEIIFIERNCTKNKIIKINYPIKKTSILELPKNTSLNLKIGEGLFFEFKDVI